MNKKNKLVDEFSYDPVTAISESNAPKEIAIIFFIHYKFKPYN